MDEQEHDRAEQIFLAALAADGEARADLVAARCADDESLKQTVADLIAAYEEAHDFLEIAAIDYPLDDDEVFPPSSESESTEPSDARLSQPDADPAPVFEAGTRIGKFTIESTIAIGGMGVVYGARQAEPDRRVALKVLRPSLLSVTGRRRFEREANILARLEHPNIARVFDAGTHGSGLGSVPYFAMEYVKDSTTLTKYAAKNDLGTTARLELFTRVCRAVAFGHANSVIHRDLKPENILVDVHGDPKVIDFGVARVTDSDVTFTHSSTSLGEFLGTLQYMSPEQCEGEPDRIDERSDVYSLGVVLYQLLCDAMPYEVSGRPIHRAIEVIREASPRLPSTVCPAIRGDLEIVILHALEKKPDDRYANVEALTDDIVRVLEGEPIRGRRPNLFRRIARSRTTRRIAVVALILIALGAAVWIGRRTTPPDEVLPLGGVVRNAPLTLVSEPDGATVHLRRIDPETGYRSDPIEVGTTPVHSTLADLPLDLEAGQYRIVFEHREAGSTEVTRYFESDQPIRVTAMIRPFEDVAAGMIQVHAGSRETYQWLTREGAALEVEVPAFLIDEHEVTNAEYRSFAEVTGYARPWYLEDDEYKSDWDALPVAGVTFDQARAYAEWHGKRLPTVLEWELAALGSSNDPYPSGFTRESLKPRVAVAMYTGDKLESRGEWLETYSSHTYARNDNTQDIGACGGFGFIGSLTEWTESIPIVSAMGSYVPERYSRWAKGLNWSESKRLDSGLISRLSWSTGYHQELIVGFRCARSLDI